MKHAYQFSMQCKNAYTKMSWSTYNMNFETSLSYNALSYLSSVQNFLRKDLEKNYLFLG